MTQSAAMARMQSDSWSGGLNFDPVSVPWVKSGNDCKLVREVSDNASIAPGQGSYDTGMFLTSLTPSQLRFTVGPAFAGPACICRASIQSHRCRGHEDGDVAGRSGPGGLGSQTPRRQKQKPVLMTGPHRK
jgi:hypothetical protein